MVRRSWVLSLSALILVSASGCGGPESSQLVGTWRPLEVDKAYGKMPGDPVGQQITFTEDGTWTASNGCAVFTGSYDLGADGTFSGEEETGSDAPCPKDGFDVSMILERADHVTFTECSAFVELHGQEMLAINRGNCQGTSILGGGLPSSE